MRRNRKVLSTHQKKRQKTETVKEVDQMLIYQRFQSSHYKYVQRTHSLRIHPVCEPREFYFPVNKRKDTVILKSKEV